MFVLKHTHEKALRALEKELAQRALRIENLVARLEYANKRVADAHIRIGRQAHTIDEQHAQIAQLVTTLNRERKQAGMKSPAGDRVYRFHYDFVTHQYYEYDYEYTYKSDTARLLFRGYPATFNGMKASRLSQYTLSKNAVSHNAMMVTISRHYAEDKAHFLKNVLRHYQRAARTN